MKSILKSIQPVVQNAKHVSINKEAIKKFVSTITPADLEQPDAFQTPAPECSSEEEYLAYALMLSAMAFCFWGKPKWGIITSNGKLMGGTESLVYCLKRALEEEKAIFSPTYWKDTSERDLQDIFRASVEIPLFSERLSMIRGMGKVLCDEFEGSVTNFLDVAEWEAEKIMELAVEKIPTVFKDESMYHGNVVKFYKRAQLIPFYIQDLINHGKIQHTIHGYEKLTALADYKAPQLLRMYGILEYDSELASKIDAEQEISYGSDEETEIRALNIEAIEEMTKLVKETFSEATPLQVHNIFWYRSQDRSLSQKPYHHTRTIWY
jgi:hypothetical protein